MGITEQILRIEKRHRGGFGTPRGRTPLTGRRIYRAPVPYCSSRARPGASAIERHSRARRPTKAHKLLANVSYESPSNGRRQSVPDYSFLRAEGPLPNRIVTDRPLSTLLADLSNSPRDERRQIREALEEVVTAIAADATQKRLDPPLRTAVTVEAAAKGEPKPVTKHQIAYWKSELAGLTPRLMDYLAQEPVEEWSPAIDMLVLTDPDGTLLMQEKERLLTSPEHCWKALMALLEIGGVIAPRDQSILVPLVAELRRLTRAERRSLCQQLDAEADSLLFGPPTVTIAIALLRSDRMQVELPYIAALITPDQPSVLRLMSLAVLTELREEAVPAIAAIRRQLQDKDSEIRLHAAFAITATSPRTVDVELLAKQADLHGDDLAAFKEATQECVEDAAELDEFIRENIDEIKQLTLHLLQSRMQTYVRQGLRLVITLQSDAEFAKRRVANLLKSEQLDAETRRLGIIAIESLKAQ